MESDTLVLAVVTNYAAKLILIHVTPLHLPSKCRLSVGLEALRVQIMIIDMSEFKSLSYSSSLHGEVGKIGDRECI